ncbi:MAG: hypothetical protein GY806_21775 [Gammaproteobacteria bacterium]|nr:hypothetical protein [Gammaproteobacteria bacterium]
MLHIERMRLQLPSGYEHRASFIARMVGESLAEFQPSENRKLDSLTIGQVQVMPNASDQEIAHNIAQRIISVLGRKI